MNNITFTSAQQEALLALTKVIAADAAITKSEHVMTCDSLLHNGLIFIDKDDLPMSFVPISIAQTAINLYGYNNETFNKTLFESFLAVANMSQEEFYSIQIFHYLTTYGTNFTTPFIVGERTFTPEETKALKITIIRAESASRSLERINELFTTTAAPKEQNIPYYRALAPLTTIAPEEIKSNELMIMVCVERGIKPSDPMALFRYIIYRASGETLIIKNRELINKIKHRLFNDPRVIDLLDSLTEDEMKALATIFYRYKPLFLALKRPMTAHPINRIRRLAIKYHKPESALTLKNFTAFAIEGKAEECDTLIARATNRELIKLYNACIAKTAGSRIYQIRNGKIWYDTKEEEKKIDVARYMNLVATMHWIRAELRDRLEAYKGKTIYVPRGISYAVPYSEKQFSGVIPWGTVIEAESADNAFTIGVHWVNDVEERHCDLDLHAHTPTNHYGWNGAYKDGYSEVIYSGDVTDAPAANGGAAEAFYINNISEPIILSLNAYSAKPNKQFQFFISEGKDDVMREHCIFDASKLACAPLPLAFAKSQALTLGIFHEKKFYVYGANLNSGAVPTGDYPKVIEELLNRIPNLYSLRALADDLGMNIVDEAPVDTPFLDFSPEALTVNSLMDFVDGDIEKLQFVTVD